MTLGGILLVNLLPKISDSASHFVPGCKETPDVDVHGSKDFDYIKWFIGLEIVEILSYKIEKKVKNC